MSSGIALTPLLDPKSAKNDVLGVFGYLHFVELVLMTVNHAYVEICLLLFTLKAYASCSTLNCSQIILLFHSNDM